jgi:putative ABC transport system ATP-binding protein
VTVLKDVSLRVPCGSALALVGPSGGGKSSLLRLWNALDPADSGRVLLDGREAGSFSPVELRRRVGLVFQTPCALAPTVEEDVTFGPRLRLDGRADPQRFRELAVRELVRVGLGGDFLARPMSRLSVGEQQRVAIARALANEPEALLLDEPTAALDPRATREILELLGRLRSELKLTVVFVSHALEQARAVGERIALLVAGEVIEEADAATFFECPHDPRTRAFVQGELRGER